MYKLKNITAISTKRSASINELQEREYKIKAARKSCTHKIKIKR